MENGKQIYSHRFPLVRYFDRLEERTGNKYPSMYGLVYYSYPYAADVIAIFPINLPLALHRWLHWNLVLLLKKAGFIVSPLGEEISIRRHFWFEV